MIGRAFWIASLVFAILEMTTTTARAALQNDRLTVSVAEDTGLLTVRDLKSGVEWRQTPIDGVTISNIRDSGDAIRLTLNGNCDARLDLGDDYLDVTIEGDPATAFEALDYPSSLIPVVATDPALVLPNCAGMVIPFSMSQDPYLKDTVPGRSYQTMVGQVGLSMPWIGVSDGPVGSFLLALTPEDAEFSVEAKKDGYAFQIQWLSSKGTLAYPRRARYCFAAEGGYVRLCKIYREYAKSQGLLVTLREKRQANPDVDKLIGAVSLWIGERPEMKLFKEMKDAGIEEALVSFHVPMNQFTFEELTDPRTNLPNEVMTPEFARDLQKMGYLAGRYHEFRTIIPREQRKSMDEMLWVDCDYVHLTGYPEQASIDAEGNMIQGFRQGGHRCSARQLEVGMLVMPPDQAAMHYNARMLDTILAVSLYECYNPAHPVTRGEDVKYRRELYDFALELGNLTGAENMNAWAVPVVDYAEGPTTFVRFHETIVGKGVGTKPVEIDDAFRNTTLNEQIRAPLWQLVFHDCVIITNRWNCTPNYFTDLDAWDKENLISILHAQTPTYYLRHEDWRERKGRIADSVKMIGDWNNQIGYEEMVDHQYLTADKKVQETIFDSGKKVIVNFGDSAYRTDEGVEIQPRDYRTINP